MKKIWIVGRKGMLARSLIEEMQKRGLDFLSTAKEEVDIASKESVVSFASKNEWSHIINCAAFTAVDLAETEKEKAYALNVIGVENLIASAKECQAKLVHISSDYVFDGTKRSPYKEEDLPLPLSVYGETKRRGEIAIQKSGIDSVILRLSWLFGKGENHFAAKMLRQMKEKTDLFVVHDQRGKMTASLDAAHVIVDLLSESGLFHFANQEETSWFSIASFIFEEAKRLGLPILSKKIHPIATGGYPTAARRPLYSVLDTTKVERVLKKPIRSWKEALSDYLQKERR